MSNERIVRHVGSTSDGKAVIAVSGPGETFLAGMLQSLADNDREVTLEAIERAEKIRDDHYSAKGELRAQITVLADHLYRILGD